MRSFINFLERLSLRILGFLLIVVGSILVFFATLVLSFVILGRIADLAQQFLPRLSVGIELFLGFPFMLIIPILIPTMFTRAIVFRYRLLKRHWLIRHGLAVNAALMGTKRIFDGGRNNPRYKCVLTFSWKPPTRKRMYTFKKTVPEIRFNNFKFFSEHPFIVIFDPDAPMFYDVQLPDEPLPLPASIGVDRSDGA